MAETLVVQLRDRVGTRNARRLRKAGSIPAVLYGHGQENLCLAVPAEQLETAVRHGGRVVTLGGAVSDRAFIRDLQWDTWGTHVVHVDLTRISEHDTVEVRLAIELRGEAPGVREGGIVQHLLHEVPIQCQVASIPDKLYVKVNNLKLGESITVANLEIPAGAKILVDPEEVVVQCVEPAVEVEEERAEAVPGEPEVIGRKKEESEEEE